MKNLLKKIDEGQPIEYVSEFRTMTLVLVSLEFHRTAWMLHLCHLIQEAALYISTVIEKGGGQLSRIFMFEKGCMFLCVFGLPGDKKPDECAHALESSFSIFSFCWENLAKTKFVSISITNGPVFCGVVGAVARHEYTVIGPKVSLAARMITAYPGLVSCDEVTYLRSMLPAYNFKKLPEKMMKNISNPGKIYEYLGHRRCIMFGKRHMARKRNKNHPLLVRETPLIFLIDEAEYTDAASWDFLETLLSTTLHRCFGNPFYCQVLCQDLLSKDVLLFHVLQKEEEENSKWETLSANAIKSIMYSISPANSEEGQELYVCAVKDDVNLDTVLLPPFLKEIAVSQLDQLSPEEQLLVKCAAIIGHSFHIDLLQHLLPGWDKNKLLQVLRALVDIHVLCWSDKSQELPAEPILMPSSINIIDGTKEKKTKLDSFQFQTKPSRTQEAFSSECCRTEEEFLDQVKRKLAQTIPEKDLLTTKPCHCKDILKLVLSPLT
nr:adenylate cyclase type 10-like isoform X3 [Gorilla gorilla gorilla]